MSDDYLRPPHQTHRFRGIHGGWQESEILWPKALGESSFSSHLQRPFLNICGIINMLFSACTNRSLEHSWVWTLELVESKVRSVQCVRGGVRWVSAGLRVILLDPILILKQPATITAVGFWKEQVFITNLDDCSINITYREEKLLPWGENVAKHTSRAL